MSYTRTDAGLFVPKHLAKSAVKHTAIVYWVSKKLNRILNGGNESVPIPPLLRKLGYEKVVCRSAHDVEVWSEKLRDQERRDEEMKDEEREAFEGPIRQILRSDIHERMANAPTAKDREFCRAFLKILDDYEERNKMKRISFQHCEAFEDGK